MMSLMQDGTRQCGPNRFRVVLDRMKKDVANSQFSHLQQDEREIRSHHSRVENHRDMTTLAQSPHGLASMLGRQQCRVNDKCHGRGLQIKKSKVQPVLQGRERHPRKCSP